jgi:hypothetical protein
VKSRKTGHFKVIALQKQGVGQLAGATPHLNVMAVY